MRLNAYVLAGDPAWIPQSVGSYYDHVDRIIVSYDRSHRSWTGDELSVAESLRRLADSDPDRKIRLLPGDHVRTRASVIATETSQRQHALDAASEGADWVIQLDTDEIVPAMDPLLRQVAIARSRAARAVEYPARMFYTRSPSGAFLEHCGRFWSTQAGFPGPVVIAAGEQLTVARQAGETPLNRVDVSPWNTDPAHNRTARVHSTVAVQHAIVHMSWVRSERQMQEKSRTSGYAANRDWESDLARWRRRARHPLLVAATTPFARDPFQRFRVVRLPQLEGIDP